jgi:hypothetical protein
MKLIKGNFHVSLTLKGKRYKFYYTTFINSCVTDHQKIIHTFIYYVLKSTNYIHRHRWLVIMKTFLILLKKMSKSANQVSWMTWQLGLGKHNDFQSHMGHTGNLIITSWTIVFGKGSSNDPFHGSNLFQCICMLFTLITAVTSSLRNNWNW